MEMIERYAKELDAWVASCVKNEPINYDNFPEYTVWLESTITHLETQQAHDLDKLAKAEARIKELEVYARHFESCKSNVAIFGKAEHYPCTCGLDNLLNRGK